MKRKSDESTSSSLSPRSTSPSKVGGMVTVMLLVMVVMVMVRVAADGSGRACARCDGVTGYGGGGGRRW